MSSYSYAFSVPVFTQSTQLSQAIPRSTPNKLSTNETFDRIYNALHDDLKCDDGTVGSVNASHSDENIENVSPNAGKKHSRNDNNDDDEEEDVPMEENKISSLRHSRCRHRRHCRHPRHQKTRTVVASPPSHNVKNDSDDEYYSAFILPPPSLSPTKPKKLRRSKRLMALRARARAKSHMHNECQLQPKMAPPQKKKRRVRICRRKKTASPPPIVIKKHRILRRWSMDEDNALIAARKKYKKYGNHYRDENCKGPWSLILEDEYYGIFFKERHRKSSHLKARWFHLKRKKAELQSWEEKRPWYRDRVSAPKKQRRGH